MSVPTVGEVVASVLSFVEGLAIQYGGEDVAVAEGKAPRQQAGTTPAAQITVSAAQRPREVKRFTSLHDLHRYAVRVTTWIPGNQGNAPVADFASIENALRQAFNKKPAGLLGFDDVRDVRAQTALYVDRGAFVKGWDVQALDVTVELVRLR